MNSILDRLKNYKEFQVEYDPDHLVVYISGLDADGFWTELDCQTDVNDPESFAQGYDEALRSLGYKSEVMNVSWEFLG